MGAFYSKVLVQCVSGYVDQAADEESEDDPADSSGSLTHNLLLLALLNGQDWSVSQKELSATLSLLINKTP